MKKSFFFNDNISTLTTLTVMITVFSETFFYIFTVEEVLCDQFFPLICVLLINCVINVMISTPENNFVVFTKFLLKQDAILNLREE